MVVRTASSIVGIWLSAALLLTGCTSADISVKDAWARPADEGGNSAVYFVIHNRSTDDIALIAAQSEAAGIVELHRSTMVQGAMKMQRQAVIDIRAGEELVFKPGDYHVMLIDLQKELTIGESFTMILHFDEADRVTLQVPVRSE